MKTWQEKFTEKSRAYAELDNEYRSVKADLREVREILERIADEFHARETHALTEAEKYKAALSDAKQYARHVKQINGAISRLDKITGGERG